MQAQPPTQNVALPPVNPKTITFEHDGKDTVGFALWVSRDGGAPVRVDLGASKPTKQAKVSVDLKGLPDGAYRIEVAAYNGAGESPRVPTDPPAFVIAKGAQKPGIFKRLWGGVIGTDGDEPPKKP